MRGDERMRNESEMLDEMFDREDIDRVMKKMKSFCSRRKKYSCFIYVSRVMMCEFF